MEGGNLYLFERCKSYKDRKISFNDLLSIIHFLKIPEQIAEQVPRDGQGRVLYDDFAMAYNSYFDDYEYSSRSRYHYPKQQEMSGKKTSDRKEVQADYRSHREERSKKSSASRVVVLDEQYPTLRSGKKKHPRSAIGSHKSEASDISDDELPYNTSTPMMPPLQRSQCKHCAVQARRIEELEEDLQAVRKERKRLENSMHTIRNDFQNYYKKASELQSENDRLRSRLGSSKYHDNDFGGDNDLQCEELRKTKRHIEEKLSHSEGVIMSLQKENNKLQDDIFRLKSERTRLHNKNREVEKELWCVQNELQDLSIQLLQEQKHSSRSAAVADKASRLDDLRFNGVGSLRKTFHGVSRQDDEGEMRQRKGLPIQRISSAGAELSGADNSQLDAPVRDDVGRAGGRRARSHKSVKSEDSDGLALHLTSIEFPEDGSTVFKVLGHEVSKGALPDTLTDEVRNAMVKSLENCHSVQEVIRLMVSYGCSPMSDKMQGIQVENERLKNKLDRIKSEHKTLQLSFQEAKEMEEVYYARCQQLECNEGYLQRSLYYCQRALEANELLIEIKSLPSEHPRVGYPSHFPTFDTASVSEESSRSPDHSSRRHSMIMKARTLLQALDTDQNLQELYHLHSQDPEASQLSTMWQPELSQNTTSGVSGISSLSSVDGDLNSEEVERLRTYGRIMKSYSNKMDCVITLEAIATRPKSHNPVVTPDTFRCDSSSPIVELEKATHAEELATIREEKAELRSRIYMMEQNQRRLELELSQKDLQTKALSKAISHLQYQIQDEKKKRKRDKTRIKKDNIVGGYEHVSDLTSELQEHMEREKELVKQYEELYYFLSEHVSKSKDNHDQLLEFIQDLKRANNALVEAYEKSKLKQKMERRHMQQEFNRAVVLGRPDQPSGSDIGVRQNQARL